MAFCSLAGLAGATADVHCYDVMGNRWTRYAPEFGSKLLALSALFICTRSLLSCDFISYTGVLLL